MERVWQSRFTRRFWKFAGGVSIRVKVLGIVIGVILLLGFFVIFQMRSLLEDTLTHELEAQGIALANNIAQDAGLVLDNIEALRLLLLERRIHYSSESHNTLVDYIVVDEDSRSIIEGHYNPTSDRIDHSHGEHHPVFVTNNGNTIEIESIIPDTSATLRLGLSRSVVVETVNQISLQLLAITLVMVAVGFAAAFFLTWILTRPILDLVSATNAVGRGDFSKRVPRWADDEIGELATAFNQMTVSLATAERERTDREHLRQQYINGVILAQENERQRIARELHDSTSQSLTSLLVGLQNLKQSRDNDELYHRVDELRHVIATTLDEIRNISWQLRPSALDDLGLVSAIKNYIQDYQKRYNIPVEAIFNGLNNRMEPEIETTVYRVIQEGLTNIARYAQATSVSLIITSKADKLKIIIEDNGIGFDPTQAKRDSLGLQGIRERAGLFGGTLTIESQPGQGTGLFIEMPRKEPPHDG